LTRACTFAERLCVDTAGPFSTKSIGGKCYAFVIVDDFSGFAWAVPMASTIEVCDILTDLIEVTLHQRHDHNVRTLRSDNGHEVINQKVSRLLAKHGIARERTCVSTSRQNGKAERAIGSLFATVRTCMAEALLPPRFWAECLAYAVYTRNRIPTTSNPHNISPFEAIHGRPPLIGHLRPFGCGCAVNTPLAKRRNKTKPVAQPGVFLGYGYVDGKKGYRVWVPYLRRVVTSFDVTFSLITDSVHARPDLHPDLVSEHTELSATLADLRVNDRSAVGHTHAPTTPSTDPFSSTPSAPTPPGLAIPIPPANPPSTSTASNNPPVNVFDGLPTVPAPDLPVDLHTNDAEVEGAIDDIPNPSDDDDGDLFDRVWGDGHPLEPPAAPISTRTRSSGASTGHGIGDSPGLALISDASPAFVAAYTTSPDLASSHSTPTSYRQAMASPDSAGWALAINEELLAVQNANVYKIVNINSLPATANLIGNTWVFKVKQNGDGSVERLKARITAKGCSQKHGVDYQESFAPVANSTTIRLVICCLVQRRLVGRSFDVKTAFLYGELHDHERVYMRVPEGVPNRDPTTCWALQKCLYGLRQSARRFNEHLHNTLTTIGYTRSKHDPCLYHNITKDSFTLLVIVVDDILMATTSDQIADEFLAAMRDTYNMKDLGRPKYTIGMHFEHSANGGYTISQRRYLNDIISRFSDSNIPSATIPMPSALRLTPTGSVSDPNSPPCDPTLYRSLVGSLMYALLTRPDVSTPVSMLARFMSAPLKIHMDSALRVLGYLRSTIDLCLHYHPSSTPSPQLKCYVDSDWAADAATRRSRYGYAIYLGSALLCWRSKLHSAITLSTAEAEYVAASETAKEILWLRQLLTEIGFSQRAATVMFEDNAACIRMATNHGVSSRNKHLEVKMHFIRDLVNTKTIKLVKIGTKEQRADIFTKNLPRLAFEKHRSSLLNGTEPDTMD